MAKIAMPYIAAKSAPTAAVHTNDQGYAKPVASILQNLASRAIAPGNVALVGRADKTHALSNLFSTHNRGLTASGLPNCWANRHGLSTSIEGDLGSGCYHLKNGSAHML
jgi:hypothetical protein